VVVHDNTTGAEILLRAAFKELREMREHKANPSKDGAK